MAGTMYHCPAGASRANVVTAAFTDSRSMPDTDIGIFLDDAYTPNNIVDIIENIKFCRNKIIEDSIVDPGANYYGAIILTVIGASGPRPKYAIGVIDPDIAVVNLAMGVVYGFNFQGITGRTALVSLTIQTLLNVFRQSIIGR